MIPVVWSTRARQRAAERFKDIPQADPIIQALGLVARPNSVFRLHFQRATFVCSRYKNAVVVVTVYPDRLAIIRDRIKWNSGRIK